MTDYRQKLQALLHELFQFDSADLDFGFYACHGRIIHPFYTEANSEPRFISGEAVAALKTTNNPG